MDYKKLNDIIANGESEKLEFKVSFNTDTIISLASMANKKGGRVVVGVSDRNEIVGVSIKEETIQQWINEIKTKTEPSLIPEIDVYTVKNINVVIIAISEYPIKPVAVKGRYYIRKQNSNHQLDLIEINDLFINSLQTSWDSLPYKDSSINNLDIGKVQNFIDKVNDSKRFTLKGSWQDCLKKLKLIKDDNKPTNASMLLFAKDNPLLNVHIGRFRTPSLIVDDKMIRGSLFEVVEDTMQYLINQIKVAFEITGKPERDEIFEYPLAALRELVINSIVHRDYANPTDIQIKIFDQEITIFNPGTLFGGLTIEDLKTDNYQAQARNKLIAKAFYLTKDIEKYGSGYRRVRELIAKYPTMYFLFMETSGGYLVKIGYNEQKISKDDIKGDTKDDTKGDTKDDTKELRIESIIKIIKSLPSISTEQLAKKLSVSVITIKRDLDLLKKQRKIIRMGGRKEGHWEIIK
jgi:ATP-dependent DNA helicase RecG